MKIILNFHSVMFEVQVIAQVRFIDDTACDILGCMGIQCHLHVVLVMKPLYLDNNLYLSNYVTVLHK